MKFLIAHTYTVRTTRKTILLIKNIVIIKYDSADHGRVKMNCKNDPPSSILGLPSRFPTSLLAHKPNIFKYILLVQ